MSFIDLGSQLPGVTGLLEYRKDTGDLLRELTQLLLRGPSTLTPGERELIATAVSSGNACAYCTTSHAAVVDAYYGDPQTSRQVIANHESAPINDKMKALLTIALKVKDNGKLVLDADIDKARKAGATDLEIHDTVMIAALFCFYNRYVDGLNTYTPTDASYYAEMAIRLKDRGYYRPTQGYLKL